MYPGTIWKMYQETVEILARFANKIFQNSCKKCLHLDKKTILPILARFKTRIKQEIVPG
jgi:hypothetical protein